MTEPTKVTQEHYLKLKSEIASEIFHGCDGLLTSMVIMVRALNLVEIGAYKHNYMIADDNGFIENFGSPIAELIDEWYEENR